MLIAVSPGRSLAQTVALPRGTSGGTVGADASNIVLETYAPAELTTLDATAWSAGERTAVAGEVSAARFESGHMLFYGSGHAALDLVHERASRVTMQGDGGGGSYRGQAGSGYGQVSLTMAHRAVAAGQTWLSAAVGRATGDGAYTTAHLAVGAATDRGPTTWSATATALHARASYADLNARLTWRATPTGDAPNAATLLLGLDAGARAGRHDEHPRWASVNAILSPGARVQFVASYGVFPSNGEQATLGARALTVGVHIALHRSSPATPAQNNLLVSSSVRVAKTGAHDEHAIFIRVPDATTVELMADFTQWAPTTLRHVNEIEWRGDFAIPPGAHRMNIRVNGGAWTPLTDTPSVPDDFGGRSSLLVVP